VSHGNADKFRRRRLRAPLLVTRRVFCILLHRSQRRNASRDTRKLRRRSRRPGRIDVVSLRGAGLPLAGIPVSVSERISGEIARRALAACHRRGERLSKRRSLLRTLPFCFLKSSDWTTVPLFRASRARWNSWENYVALS